MTNYEDIKRMSIDEMADFLANSDEYCIDFSCKADAIKWLKSKAKEHICSCYYTEIRKEPRYNTITGLIDYYVDVEYSRCRGTRECDICFCGGNRKKCDFY